MSIINDVLVNKLFKDPPKRTKEIPLLSEKTASGDGMVVINDAYSDFPIKNLTLQGNTKQDSTTGVQLWNTKGFVLGELQQNGEIKENPSGNNAIIKINLDFDSECGIRCESDSEQGVYIVSMYNAVDGKTNPYIKVLKGQTSKINLKSGENILQVVGFAGTQTTKFTGNEKIMLVKGTSIPPYEPYTGGKPSPSPDYPQEIKNVGKWNEETQKYEVDVILSAKNLFNLNRLKKGFVTSTGNGFKIDENTSYVSSVYLDMIISLKHGQSLSISGILQDKSRIRVKHDIGNYYNKYTANKDTEIMVCFYSGLTEEDKEKCMIEIGGMPTEYEPYKEQTIKITSDRPITKWDKLVEQDGQIGWLYGSRRYILTGNEVFESRNGYNIESYTNRFFILNDLLTENDALKPLAYMKCLRRKQYVYAPNIFEEGFETNKGQFHIKFLNERVGISTSDDNEVRTLKYSEYVKKMYKDGNPIEILYATKNKEFVPLPQSEQDVIRALLTYYPTTVVTVDGGELPVGIEVTYMHPEYIPTKQSALRMWFKENPII